MNISNYKLMVILLKYGNLKKIKRVTARSKT